jgi:DNA-binding winged helix-turn-helix (wHTH) protein
MDRKYRVFRFGGVEVREREFSVARENEVSPVEPKAFRVLLFFLNNPGKLITKGELLSAVWSDAVVTYNSLTRSIALLRRALGDDLAEPRFIATVPTVGYRFLLPVETSDDGPGSVEHLPSTEPAPADSPGAVPQLSRSPVALPRRWWLVAAVLLLLPAVGLVRWSRRQASQTELSESQLTRHSSDNPLSGLAISPDGKYLLFADNAGVHIMLLQTGEVRDIQWQSVPWPRTKQLALPLVSGWLAIPR